MGKVQVVFYGFLLEYPNSWFVVRGDNTGKVTKVNFGTREQVILEAWKRNQELVLVSKPKESPTTEYTVQEVFAGYGRLSAVKRKRNRTMTSEQARATIAKRWIKANPKYSLPPPRDKPDSPRTEVSG